MDIALAKNHQGIKQSVDSRESLVPTGRVGIDVYHIDALRGLDQGMHIQEDLVGIPTLHSFVAYNMFVASGRRYLGNLLRGGFSAPTDVGVGTSAAPVVDSETTLVAETFRDALTQRLDIVDGLRFRFFLTSTSANGVTLREAGIFGPSPGLLMLNRVTFADIVKTSSIAVNFSWDVTFSQV